MSEIIEVIYPSPPAIVEVEVGPTPVIEIIEYDGPPGPKGDPGPQVGRSVRS